MTQLSRKLTTFGLTMIAIGSCIGSGIFITPAMIADHMKSWTGILGVWALGGLVALAGALSLAYLGMLFTQTGGVYIYIRERYGKLAAFSYGWIILTVVTSGAIAALGMACARYIDFLIPLGDHGIVCTAIGLIVVVTLVNLRGVKKADLFATFFTMIKLIGILIVIGVGLSYTLEVKESIPLAEAPASLWGAIAGAMIGIIWSYGGWHHASYVAGEAIQPAKSVPRAMIIGTIIVSFCYVIVNLAYLNLLGPEGMAASKAVASDAISVRFEMGAQVVAVLIALSTFGTMGIYTLSAPRIYFAMAKDGSFFPGLARIHPVYRTPVFSILLQSGWAILLVLFWGTFENLITYVVFMDWVFMALAVGAVFHFYRSDPSIKYRIPLYPLTPLFFVVVAAIFLIRILYDNPVQAWAGLILLLSGWPIYYFSSRRGYL